MEYHRITSYLVNDSYFPIAVDLGCGMGLLAEHIRSNVGYLIGVDHNETRLKNARKTGFYDEVILEDARFYVPPANTDIVFFLEVIEHIPKEDGLEIINRLMNVPVFILTTPDKYFSFAIQNGHVSHWHHYELNELGFKTYLFRRSAFWEYFYGKGLLAFRTPMNLSKHFENKLSRYSSA